MDGTSDLPASDPPSQTNQSPLSAQPIISSTAQPPNPAARQPAGASTAQRLSTSGNQHLRTSGLGGRAPKPLDPAAPQLSSIFNGLSTHEQGSRGSKRPRESPEPQESTTSEPLDLPEAQAPGSAASRPLCGSACGSSKRPRGNRSDEPKASNALGGGAPQRQHSIEAWKIVQQITDKVEKELGLQSLDPQLFWNPVPISTQGYYATIEHTAEVSILKTDWKTDMMCLKRIQARCTAGLYEGGVGHALLRKEVQLMLWNAIIYNPFEFQSDGAGPRSPAKKLDSINKCARSLIKKIDKDIFRLYDHLTECHKCKDGQQTPENPIVFCDFCAKAQHIGTCDVGVELPGIHPLLPQTMWCCSQSCSQEFQRLRNLMCLPDSWKTPPMILFAPKDGKPVPATVFDPRSQKSPEGVTSRQVTAPQMVNFLYHLQVKFAGEDSLQWVLKKDTRPLDKELVALQEVGSDSVLEAAMEDLKRAERLVKEVGTIKQPEVVCIIIDEDDEELGTEDSGPATPGEVLANRQAGNIAPEEPQGTQAEGAGSDANECEDSVDQELLRQSQDENVQDTTDEEAESRQNVDPGQSVATVDLQPAEQLEQITQKLTPTVCGELLALVFDRLELEKQQAQEKLNLDNLSAEIDQFDEKFHQALDSTRKGATDDVSFLEKLGREMNELKEQRIRQEDNKVKISQFVTELEGQVVAKGQAIERLLEAQRLSHAECRPLVSLYHSGVERGAALEVVEEMRKVEGLSRKRAAHESEKMRAEKENEKDKEVLGAKQLQSLQLKMELEGLKTKLLELDAEELRLKRSIGHRENEVLKSLTSAISDSERQQQEASTNVRRLLARLRG